MEIKPVWEAASAAEAQAVKAIADQCGPEFDPSLNKDNDPICIVKAPKPEPKKK